MSRLTLTILVSLPLFAACAAPSNTRAHISVLGGVRSYDNTDFDKVDKQAAYGVEGVAYLGDGGLGIEAGWQHADDESTDTTGLQPQGLETDEFYGGLRYTFLKDSLIEPYIAGGATWLDTSVDLVGGGTADADAWAAYAHAGVAFNLSALRLGVDVRGVWGSDLSFPGADSDADYYQAMAFAGLRF